METENIYTINYKIPEIPLEQYTVLVNTFSPKAEYSANWCLFKGFGTAHWETKNRTNVTSSNPAQDTAGKLMSQKLRERKKEAADCLHSTDKYNDAEKC